jgi:hypothetical protein
VNVIPLIVLIVLLCAGAYVGARTGLLQQAWESIQRSMAEASARSDQHRAAVAGEQDIGGIETSLTPANVLDGVTEIMTRSGYGVESRTENTVTFAKSAQPNFALGCILAILLLIPAVIYFLMVAGKTKRVTVAAYPLGAGSRAVIGGDDRNAVTTIQRWVHRLQYAPAEEQIAEALPGQSTADRLRELDRLKESGLISDEEHRTSRARILGEV